MCRENHIEQIVLEFFGVHLVRFSIYLFIYLFFGGMFFVTSLLLCACYFFIIISYLIFLFHKIFLFGLRTFL